jgi:hypothetical protein
MTRWKTLLAALRVRSTDPHVPRSLQLAGLRVFGQIGSFLLVP